MNNIIKKNKVGLAIFIAGMLLYLLEFTDKNIKLFQRNQILYVLNV